MLDIIKKFPHSRILVVGDLMIDAYLWGEVDRISPEAPVQVVSVQREEFTLGGSGNVIHNLAVLGAKVSAVGVTGEGADGTLLVRRLQELGIDSDGVILDPARCTTRKTRVIAANQHVVRIDRETRKEISGSVRESLAAAVEKKIPEADVVLVSDYAKGVVSPDLMSRLTACARKHRKVVIADPKGLDFTRYAGVTALTPNKKEAGLAAGIEIPDEGALFKAAERILGEVSIERLLVTCGKEGMVLFERGEAPFRIRAEARQVYDVSGAGDTVLAVLGLAVAAGASFREGAGLANTAAGIVVGKVGTATVSPKELSDALSISRDGSAAKRKTIPEIAASAAEERKRGKRIVLTNGCFDLLHAGHVRLLSASKQMGDVLVVAIDDDDSVRRLKGDGRPVLGEKERVAILSALDVVDYVVVFSSEDLPRVIEAVRPDVLTKGSNYAACEVTGHELIERIGGRVALVPVMEEISSSRIIRTIRRRMTDDSVKPEI